VTVNVALIPNKLYLSGELIPDHNVTKVFVKFFDTKIKNILGAVEINDGVYNRIRLVESGNKICMDPGSIREFMLSLKLKNLEGIDRIPQGV
jgi:hypothetical protein